MPSVAPKGARLPYETLNTLNVADKQIKLDFAKRLCCFFCFFNLPCHG